ncbi:unnamed protein product [Somion occarium]|uniref:Uncharacterized protein n=1 Tax=Somion occarium TaxID=3059160 RepID=A0ABP1DNR2_9APHY
MADVMVPSMSSQASGSGTSEASKSRTASLLLSSPSRSHTPGSIFPDMHGPHPRVSLGGRPDFTRRHTTYLASPTPRPIRSSPLAGPSLALGQDGTLTGSDDSHSDSDSDQARHKRPSRISSSPDVPSTLTFSACSSEDGPLDPKSASSPHLEQGELPPLPSIPSASRLSRRLSWGLTKLTELPTLSRSSSSSSKSSQKEKEKEKEDVPPPPVPDIPIWARPSSTSRSSPSLRSTASNRRSLISPPSATPVRRPTTSSGTSARAATVNRRSTYLGQPAEPSVSRDPELNWLTQAAPPKFSRHSLKAEGVVMPVSARDVKFANRRSVIIAPPPVATSQTTDSRRKSRDGVLVPPSRSVSRASSMASLGSVASEMSGTIMPSPSFRVGSFGGSSSSIDSAISSLLPATPTLSLSRSTSVNSTVVADEMGVLSRPCSVSFEKDVGRRKEDERRGVVLELRVNDVHVEVMGKSESRRTVVVTECKPTSESNVAGGKTCGAKKTQAVLDGTLQRGRGTIERAWKRVIRSVSVKA